jgi:large subunit ribosomal protein L2
MNFNSKEVAQLLQQDLHDLRKINSELLRKKPLLKKNIKKLNNVAGRNCSGKITVKHKGSGHKKKYREINFLRTNVSMGITCSLEYDPNRNAFIAAIYDFYHYLFFYVLAPKNLKIGDILESGFTIEPKLGYSLPLTQIPVGSYIHNVSLKSTKFAQISRSAGTFSILKKKMLNYAVVELGSGVLKYMSTKCFATIGSVSNEFACLSKLTKAGQSR